jgi:hypothetical protein
MSIARYLVLNVESHIDTDCKVDVDLTLGHVNCQLDVASPRINLCETLSLLSLLYPTLLEVSVARKAPLIPNPLL